MTARGGWVAGCTCSGFDTRMDRLFVRFTNCSFGSRCHIHVKLYISTCIHDTEEHSSVRQSLKNKT